MAGPLIFLGIETEDPVAGAVINRGVLETLGASDFNFFDIHLHTVPRTLSTEKRELPRMPLRLAAEGADTPGADRSGELSRRRRECGVLGWEIARDKARKSSRLPAAAPGQDRLPIQAKPPSSSLNPMFGCIIHEGQTAPDRVVMAPRIFSIVSSLLVIVGMRSLLQMACDSSAVEGPMLKKILQRGHQTDFPPRAGQTCIPERGRSDRLDWAHARINLRHRIAFFAYG